MACLFVTQPTQLTFLIFLNAWERVAECGSSVDNPYHQDDRHRPFTCMFKDTQYLISLKGQICAFPGLPWRVQRNGKS